ncbi:MAG: DUF6483 family protein [Peptococcaceae bacterium]|nr:DUF6483 family protein [Peptococcaceae bacterium]
MSLSEKDFLMRQFTMLARFLSQVFFSKVISGQEQILYYDHTTAQRNDGLSAELTDLAKEGKINEAENKLFQVFEQDPSACNFATAVYFYESLLHWDEADLEKVNFSVDEISNGFQDICRMYGIDKLL